MDISNSEASGRWVITNERQGASPLLGFLPLFESMTTDIGKYLQVDFNLKSLVEFSSRHVRMACIDSDWEYVGKLTIEKLQTAEFSEWVINGLRSETVHLNRVGNDLRKMNFTDCSNDVLKERFNATINALKRFIVFNNFVNVSDFYHELFTKELLLRLQTYPDVDSATDANALYAKLTTPTKTVWIQEEEVDFLQLLANIQKSQSTKEAFRSGTYQSMVDEYPDLGELLQDHVDKYFWIEYEQEGKVLSGKYFFERVCSALGAGIDAVADLQKVRQRRLLSTEAVEQAVAQINLNEADEHLFSVAQLFVYWKLHLREVKVRLYCCADVLMEEIGTRLDLDRYQVRHLTEEEVVHALDGIAYVSSEEVSQRMEYCVFQFSSGEVIVHKGESAKSTFSIVEEHEVTDTNAVQGVCAHPGYVEGVVRQVLTVADADKFQEGEVLVAYMTDVGVVSAMKKARAIVTDVGGVTCHASIIAREFGIPCVIGTRNATRVLKDGYRVRIDAINGTVEVLSKEKVELDGENSVHVTGDVISLSAELPSSKRVFYPQMSTRLFSSISAKDIVFAGGKGAALGQLSQWDMPVPEGFVISTSVFEELFYETETGQKINNFLRRVRDRASLHLSLEEIHDIVCCMKVSDEILHEIDTSFTALSCAFVAVRSSATSEDSVAASWAGQLDSFLNTTKDSLLDNIRKCWASLFSERAILYREYRDSSDDDMSMAVVVQKMISSRIAGTAFSVHPVTGLDSILIESCVGLGETLVLGREIPTSFIINRNSLQVIDKKVVPQRTAMRQSKNGPGNENFVLTEIESMDFAMSSAEAREVAQLVLDVERKYGFPVDIEWAYEGERLYLLQSRPITTLS